MAKLGRADLHMHTSVSDGLYTSQQVLDYIAKCGKLDVIAITDHDRLDASLWAYERRANYPFDIIPGLEVTSYEGHVLALWVTEMIPPNMSLAETATAIHEQGGVCILAHPFHFHIGDTLRGFRKYWQNPNILREWAFDAIEIHNAGILIPGCNLLARHILRDVALPVTGSSDAHSLHAIGTGYTHFPGKSADDLRAALMAHTTQAHGGLWTARDYLEIARALPNWKSPKKPVERTPLTDADIELA